MHGPSRLSNNPGQNRHRPVAQWLAICRTLLAVLRYFEYNSRGCVKADDIEYMKKLILGVLAAGMLTSAQAGGHWGGGHGGGHFWGGFGVGVASGLALGAVASSPWYYDDYYPYYSYRYRPFYDDYYYYAPSYYSAPAYVTPAPAAPTAPQPAPAAPAQSQPTTVINNYYYNSTPMSGANSLF